MPDKDEMKQGFPKPAHRIVIGLVISWLLPVVLFKALQAYVPSDTAALAIVTAIPILRTAILWVWQRRVDWIGLIGALGFVIALVVTALSGGSSLPIKLYHPVITGTLGLVLLISVIIKRPLLLLLLKAFNRIDPEVLAGSAFRKKVTILSAVLGLLALADAVIHIVMAISLPTGTYVGASKAVSFVAVAAMIGIRWWMGRRSRLR